MMNQGATWPLRRQVVIWCNMRARGSHAEHTIGQNSDVGTSNVASDRHSPPESIFINNGVVSFLDEGNHWYLRF